MTTDVLLAPKLKSGDLVRLVSPASYPPQTNIDDYIRVVESWGLRCDTGDHVLDQCGYMAGTDAARLADLNNAFADPEVRAIIATRGGAGAYRIADDIDFDTVSADPKPLVGFSDITSLQLSLQNQCQLGSIHGCLHGTTAQRTVKRLLTTIDAISLSSVPGSVSATVRISGRTSGRLTGGNLQALATAVGVRLPPMNGAILFIEYHKTGLGTVDRYLTQLLRSGALDGITGVALGSFECLRDFTDRGWTITDVLNDRLSPLNVPVLGGIYAGHDLMGDNGDHDQSALPLGSMATLDADAGTLTIDPVVF